MARVRAAIEILNNYVAAARTAGVQPLTVYEHDSHDEQQIEELRLVGWTLDEPLRGDPS